MASEAQLAANRLNAQRSTGPQTAAGKAASSRNSVKFALSSLLPTLNFEDEDDFEAFRSDLVKELKPTDNLELTLVYKIATHFWCAQRAGLAQDLCFSDDLPVIPDAQERKFALYMRYQTMHDRAFYKAQQELMKLQAARKAEQTLHALRQGKVFLQQVQLKLSQRKLDQRQPAAPAKPVSPAQPSPATGVAAAAPAVPMPVAA